MHHRAYPASVGRAAPRGGRIAVPGAPSMEQDGWVRADWGATAKNRQARFYVLTAAGKKQLAAEQESWARLTEGVTRVLRYA